MVMEFRGTSMRNSHTQRDWNFQKGIVDSLYGAKGPTIIGAISGAVIAGVCMISSGENTFAVFAVLFLLTGIIRLAIRDLYFRDGHENYTLEQLKFWRRACIVAGTLTAMLLGAFCFFAIVFSTDPFTEMAAISVALTNSVGIAARNFGSRRFVAAQSIVIGLPIVVGLFLVGTWQEMVLGTFYGTFIMAVMPMATSLRNVLHSAIHREAQVSTIADELGVAVETMPNGLLMFDEQKRLKVSNSEASNMLGLDLEDSEEAPSARDIFRLTVREFGLNAEMTDMIETKFQKLRTGDDPLEVILHKPTGQIFRFVTKAGEDGNLVVRIDDITAEETANAKIASMARYDTLTGLSNRGWFFEQTGQQIEEMTEDQSILIAVIDLDNFKTINDTHGHPAGDAILTSVARRLQNTFGPLGICGRLGGDEFVLFFPLGAADQNIAESYAQKIGQCVEGVYRFLDLELDVDASVGVAYDKQQDASVDELISKADFAQYEAKRLTGTNVCIFEDNMQQNMQRQMRLIVDLKEAVANNQLHCVFQPIISTSKCRVSGYEALCRWNHAELGFISPAEFIPIAEDLGLISQITDIQLHKACRACSRLPGDISVSVNLSAIDFRTRDILDTIKSALASSGLPATRLIVEVTETSLLDLKPQTMRLVNDIRALGVRVALDDFGVGYSSLSYLNKLELDRLKIDRSFVVEIADSDKTLKVISAIAHLARDVGMELVIEGVETPEQLETICDEVEVDLFQGFLFGAPLDEDVIVEFSNRTFPSNGRVADANKSLTA